MLHDAERIVYWSPPNPFRFDSKSMQITAEIPMGLGELKTQLEYTILRMLGQKRYRDASIVTLEMGLTCDQSWHL